MQLLGWNSPCFTRTAYLSHLEQQRLKDNGSGVESANKNEEDDGVPRYIGVAFGGGMVMYGGGTGATDIDQRSSDAGKGTANGGCHCRGYQQQQRIEMMAASVDTGGFDGQ